MYTYAPRSGPNADERRAMLDTLGYESLEVFTDAVVPEAIRFRATLARRAVFQ